MKTINLKTQTGVRSIVFPDNQPHIQIDTNLIKEGDEVQVIVNLERSNEVLELLQISNALDHMFVKKKSLVIPYLMGARFDRVMSPGDSFDLEVIADLINSCQFEKVNLFDVHSDVATALIKRSKNHNNSLLVKAYDKTDAVLIVPDAGAAKKVSKYLEWNPNIKDVVNCVKERDLATGKITLKVLEPSKCFAQNCVIIDDICDGGATFNAIAEALKTALHTTLPASQSLTLIVSHGLFSKGFTELKKNFSQIITSDSIKGYYETDLVKVVPIFAKL